MKRFFLLILMLLALKSYSQNPAGFKPVTRYYINGKLAYKLTDYGSHGSKYLEIYNSIGHNNSIASILDYTKSYKVESKYSDTVLLENRSYNNSNGVIGIIGAGNFTKMTMLPALKGSGAVNKYIASAGGVNGTALAKKYNFSHSTTNFQEILKDSDVDLVLITTRHNQHASQTVEALKHGKHVFVEKPLALNFEELNAIIEAYNNSNTKPTLTVGFNRRFSPHSIAVKKALGQSGPLNIVATMNAGFIPSNVWIHDLKIGGGRIIGEACHFIDLISCLKFFKNYFNFLCVSVSKIRI